MRQRTVLLTGATGSIGSAIACELARGGVRVILHYGRNHDAANALVQEIGQNSFSISADFNTPQGATQLWSQAVAKAGRIDAVINNAGILSKVSVISMHLSHLVGLENLKKLLRL